jgi:hypothetical protein
VHEGLQFHAHLAHTVLIEEHFALVCHLEVCGAGAQR